MEGRVVWANRYAIFDEIASGGMATVYAAGRLGQLNGLRVVAIKKLFEQFARDKDFVAMFLDEARLAASIRHENVIKTYQVIRIPGSLAIVMELVVGVSLAELLRGSRDPNDPERRIALPPAIAGGVIGGVLRGLHAAHEAFDETGAPFGLIHRDVSPQNILVGKDGIPRVIDFGIAKAAGRMQATEAGVTKGKFAYMAPEQIRHGTLDRRTDIYAAGVVLWEALTGRRLFYAPTDAALIMRRAKGDIRPAPPSQFNAAVTRAGDALVLKALEPAADQRFSSAAEMADAVEKELGSAPVQILAAWVLRVAGEKLRALEAKYTAVEHAITSGELDELTQVMRPVRDEDDGQTEVMRPMSDVPPPPLVEFDVPDLDMPPPSMSMRGRASSPASVGVGGRASSPPYVGVGGQASSPPSIGGRASSPPSIGGHPPLTTPLVSPIVGTPMPPVVELDEPIDDLQIDLAPAPYPSSPSLSSSSSSLKPAAPRSSSSSIPSLSTSSSSLTSIPATAAPIPPRRDTSPDPMSETADPVALPSRLVELRARARQILDQPQIRRGAPVIGLVTLLIVGKLVSSSLVDSAVARGAQRRGLALSAGRISLGVGGLTIYDASIVAGAGDSRVRLRAPEVHVSLDAWGSAEKVAVDGYDLTLAGGATDVGSLMGDWAAEPHAALQIEGTSGTLAWNDGTTAKLTASDTSFRVTAGDVGEFHLSTPSLVATVGGTPLGPWPAQLDFAVGEAKLVVSLDRSRRTGAAFTLVVSPSLGQLFSIVIPRMKPEEIGIPSSFLGVGSTPEIEIGVEGQVFPAGSPVNAHAKVALHDVAFPGLTGSRTTDVNLEGEIGGPAHTPVRITKGKVRVGSEVAQLDGFVTLDGTGVHVDLDGVASIASSHPVTLDTHTWTGAGTKKP